MLIDDTINQYRIIDRLGEGGMGVVYLADDTRLQRKVALKFVSSVALDSTEEVARFHREARAAARLNHPNICTVYELGETEDKTFIAMEYVEGISLKERMQQGNINEAEIRTWLAQISQGLQVAHDAGVIHRDIKPANIMITGKGLLKIMDFGIARLVEGETELTQANSTIGTIAYMSPEQARGEDIDHRTDIWSVGVILYELTTGQRPFSGAFREAIMYAMMHEDAPSPSKLNPNISPDLESITNRCLQRERGVRYESMSDLLGDLKYKADEGLETHRGLPWLTGMGYWQRKKIVLGILFSIAVVVLMGLWLSPSMRDLVETTSSTLGISNEQRLAVLPFRSVNFSLNDSDVNVTEAFAAGLLETLTSSLARSESFTESPFWVVPAGEILRYNITSPIEVRQIFGVNLVIDGSIQNDEDGLRLTLNLSNPSSEPARLIDSEVIDFQRSDVRLIQDLAYNAIVKMIDLPLQPQAKEAVMAGITLRPEANEFYIQGLGYLQRSDREENIDTAIKLFSRALEEDSDFALAHAGLARAYELKYYVTRENKWVDSSLTRARYALKLDDKVANAYLVLGSVARRANRLEEALDAYEQAIKLDPANSEAFGGLAQVYMALDKPTEAQNTLQEAITLKPSYWRSYDRLAYFFVRQGRMDEAIEQYEMALQLTPDNSWVLNNLGATAYILNRWDQAEKYFEESLRLNPQDYQVRTNLGTVYYHQEQYTNAVSAYEKALELRDTDYRTWSYLGDAYQWIPGRHSSAESAYRRTIELLEDELLLRPNSLDLLVHKAATYARLNELQNARELLEYIITAFELIDSYNSVAIGTIYELLGDRDRAVNWILEALPDELMQVKHSPWLTGLREDERIRNRLSP